MAAVQKKIIKLSFRYIREIDIIARSMPMLCKLVWLLFALYSLEK